MNRAAAAAAAAAAPDNLKASQYRAINEGKL